MEYQPDCSIYSRNSIQQLVYIPDLSIRTDFHLGNPGWTCMNSAQFNSACTGIIVNNNITIAVIRHNQSVSPPNLSPWLTQLATDVKYPVGSGHYTRLQAVPYGVKRTRYTSTACIHPDNFEIRRRRYTNIPVSWSNTRWSGISSLIRDTEKSVYWLLFHPYDRTTGSCGFTKS